MKAATIYTSTANVSTPPPYLIFILGSMAASGRKPWHLHPTEILEPKNNKGSEQLESIPSLNIQEPEHIRLCHLIKSLSFRSLQDQS